MKRLYTTLFPLLCCLLLAITVQAQKHQIGVNLDNMLTNVNGETVIAEDAEIDFNNYESSYFTIGIYYRFAPYKRRLSWQTALRYGSLWYRGNVDFPDDLSLDQFYPNLHLHILHIPLNVQVDLGHDVKALFGLSFHQLFVDKEESDPLEYPSNQLRYQLDREVQQAYEQAINESQIFWEAGLKLGFGRVEIQAKYQSLLTDFFNKINLQGESYQLDVTYTTYQFGMSYRLFGSY